MREPLQTTGAGAGLMAILEVEGFEVTAASTGAEALAIVHTIAPDAVVLDVGLPDMSGVDVYQRIARERPDLPVLFSTGEGDLRLLREPLAQHVGYLLKPYAIEVLLDQLARLMAGTADVLDGARS